MAKLDYILLKNKTTAKLFRDEKQIKMWSAYWSVTVVTVTREESFLGHAETLKRSRMTLKNLRVKYFQRKIELNESRSQ